MTSMRVYTDNHLAAEPWRRSAACAEVDPELFFPEKYDMRTAAQARRICGTCEVSAECLASALERNEQYGIFAGLTLTQRRRLVKGKP